MLFRVGSRALSVNAAPIVRVTQHLCDVDPLLVFQHSPVLCWLFVFANGQLLCLMCVVEALFLMLSTGGLQVFVVHNCGPWKTGSSQPVVDAIPAPLELVEALGSLLPCAVRDLQTHTTCSFIAGTGPKPGCSNSSSSGDCALGTPASDSSGACLQNSQNSGPGPQQILHLWVRPHVLPKCKPSYYAI